MIRLNLLPKLERRDYTGIGQLVLGLIVLVALFAVLAALYILQENKIGDLQHRIQKAEIRKKELEKIKVQVDDFKAKNRELTRRIEIINVLERNRTGPLYVMDSLAQSIPSRAWIDEFSETGFKAKMIGIADNEFTVADFLEALQQSPYFKGVELGVIKKTELRKQDLRSFDIYATLVYTGDKKKEPSKKPAPGEKGANKGEK